MYCGECGVEIQPGEDSTSCSACGHEDLCAGCGNVLHFNCRPRSRARSTLGDELLTGLKEVKEHHEGTRKLRTRKR